MSLSDFEDDDIMMFETCIIVNEKLINVAHIVYCEILPHKPAV